MSVLNENQKKVPLIFVAEDLPKNLQVVYNILTKEGYDIAAAGDGKKALEMLQKLRPDLILLDVMMPEMDGFQLCRQLKQMPQHKDVPIIFLTAKVESKDIIEGLELGAVDYITKPFKTKELLTRVKNHLDLKFAREALKVANTAKEKLFSIIAHDVKNPLQNLLLSAHLLDSNFDQFDTPRIKEYVHKFFTNTNVLVYMMDNLLEWARSQQQEIIPAPEHFPLIEIVAKIGALLKPDAEKKQITLKNNIADDISPYADKNMVRIILRNLMSNALKFTPVGGEVVVDARKDEDGVTVTVADTGVGIPAEALPGIFELENHRSTVGTAGEKGTGLGLVLCRELVEKNNGVIRVHSEVGKGTTFTVTFPKDADGSAADW